MRFFLSLLAVLAFAAAFGYAAEHASANDSVAEMKTGGLVLARTDNIAIRSETLFISMDEIRVEYLFENLTARDINSIVAFPMPDLTGSLYEAPALPGDAKDNFLDFMVTVNDREIRPNLQQRAWAGGLDVTDALTGMGISPVPGAQGQREKLNSLADSAVAELRNRGVVAIDEYDAGQGMQRDVTAIWTLKSAYWWEMAFPASKTVRVSHRYKPSIGGSASVTFVTPEGKRGYTYDEYEKKYCIEDGVYPAAAKRVRQAGENGPYYHEAWISYILLTGNNWAGPIGEFRLIIDKGSKANLVSFCGQGVNKIGPTTFEMVKRDFVAERNLDVLFVLKGE